MAALAQNLPVLLFGVQAGVVADRVDRVRLMAAVNLVRAAILAVLAVTIVSGAVSIAIVLVALFVLGTAETFADIGGQSVLPRLVRREDLGVANARLSGGVLLTNQLLAPPIGALLFAIGMALPFVADAAGFALGARADHADRLLAGAPSRRPASAGTGATRWPRACAGSPATRRCARWRSPSSPSTSRSAPRGRCSSCTRRSGWA